ncbi:MAG TPA: DNA photolyase [Desulfobacteraceae bacterium]|nr:DNA photolyase [Desulfobacteraceae bacterium]
MPSFKPRINRVIVEEGAADRSLGSKILSSIPAGSIPIDRIACAESKSREGSEHADGLGKDVLHLLSYKGEFLKPCPGTKNYICCGYRILNVGTNCPMDCSYCILQSYFNNPNLRVFTNLDEQIRTVLDEIDSAPWRIHRIGTGEFTDSLALDHLTGWAQMLIPLFSTRKNSILELKTKTDNINGVLKTSERDRIVISWSLNSSYISTREEHRAPSLRARLEAARRCQAEGFVVGFHFDPIVVHDGWKEGYARTIDLLDTMIEPDRVIWISMGSMRYMPALKAVIRSRHPKTCILDGEFVTGLDGKMRYFKPIRIELYREISERLNTWHPDLGIYLCMESDDVWKNSMGWSPGTSKGLACYLDSRVVRIFGWR